MEWDMGLVIAVMLRRTWLHDVHTRQLLTAIAVDNNPLPILVLALAQSIPISFSNSTPSLIDSCSDSILGVSCGRLAENAKDSPKLAFPAKRLTLH